MEGRNTLGDTLGDGKKKVSYSGRVNKRSGRVNGGQDEGKWLTGGWGKQRKLCAKDLDHDHVLLPSKIHLVRE